ncbi:hypothetical protein SESBI_43292 [Sesbania bispinosa]|nr:hypothetical protein SESBI_43292 [Sesbania bispinosa]
MGICWRQRGAMHDDVGREQWLRCMRNDLAVNSGRDIGVECITTGAVAEHPMEIRRRCIGRSSGVVDPAAL